jgi:hypothetical protein
MISVSPPRHKRLRSAVIKITSTTGFIPFSTVFMGRREIAISRAVTTIRKIYEETDWHIKMPTIYAMQMMIFIRGSSL